MAIMIWRFIHYLLSIFIDYYWLTLTNIDYYEILLTVQIMYESQYSLVVVLLDGALIGRSWPMTSQHMWLETHVCPEQLLVGTFWWLHWFEFAFGFGFGFFLVGLQQRPLKRIEIESVIRIDRLNGSKLNSVTFHSPIRLLTNWIGYSDRPLKRIGDVSRDPIKRVLLYFVRRIELNWVNGRQRQMVVCFSVQSIVIVETRRLYCAQNDVFLRVNIIWFTQFFKFLLFAVF